jgi:UDP-N-acetylmuramyl pentapeptide phosphotransferase/UDP-N-acetylglucosamine-1-phosphate transferase
MSLEQLFPAVISGVVTLVLGATIIFTQRWHGHWTYDGHEGVQKFHTQPTSRIGGLAIFLGVLVAILSAEEDVKTPTISLVVAGMIPFYFGLSEDITKRVSIAKRLLATMVGALVAILLTDSYLHRVDIPGIDQLVAWWPVGVVLTMVAVSGVTNAVNILDGFNGLASGTALVILIIFAVMAHQVQDLQLLELSLVLAGSMVGFMLLNYPLGKIFLGDAGAYFVGFLVAWIALLLPVRHENISPWAALLVCAYPVTEVLYSMVRRMLKQQLAGQPDSDHLHSLIKKRLVRRYFSFLPTWAKNAMVAPSIWFCSVCTGLLAQRFTDNAALLSSFYVGFVLWYHLSYRFLSRMPEYEG